MLLLFIGSVSLAVAINSTNLYGGYPRREWSPRVVEKDNENEDVVEAPTILPY